MGFAGDKHRLNVALTRAKRHLLLIGSMPVLQSGSEAFKLLLAAACLAATGKPSCFAFSALENSQLCSFSNSLEVPP